MSVWVSEGTRVRVSKRVKNEAKYSTAHVSSSSKKLDGTYEYSNWSFATFLGDAHKMFDLVQEGAILSVKKGYVSNVKREDKDGETIWNNPKLIVLDFEVYRAGTGGDEPSLPNEDDDSIPF